MMKAIIVQRCMPFSSNIKCICQNQGMEKTTSARIAMTAC